MKVLILDFYVDEPACFGVPPYISPYVRYTAGALVCGGLQEENIDYLSVDALRENAFQLEEEYGSIFLIMGSTVPGKYLGGRIGTVADLYKFLENLYKQNKHAVCIIGGPIRYASSEIKEEIKKRRGILVRGDIEHYAEIYPSLKKEQFKEKFIDNPLKQKRTYDDVNRYAKSGAFITLKHPNYPYLILELETYRGCTRDIYCSFCTEAFYGRPSFRDIAGILQEVKELYNLGNSYFRLGRQADIMTYLPNMQDFSNSFPRPNPENLLKLYRGIRETAPNLKLLHLDNINPGLIATFPKESAEILDIISEYNTEGDTAAMGLESMDPLVIQKNDLKCSPEEAKLAIRLVNKYGAKRKNGIPKLLPGLNFIGGLPGEDKNTFKKNYEFLKDLLEEGLLLRRINIRQVILYDKTKAARMGNKVNTILENRFAYYRDKIRKEIDEPMLKITYPSGSILENVILEQKNNGYYLGRQLGSYPITVKIPAPKNELPLKNKPVNILITGHAERSIKGLSYPINPNSLTDLCYREIPGISKTLASKTILSSPFSNEKEFAEKAPEAYHHTIKLTKEIIFH